MIEETPLKTSQERQADRQRAKVSNFVRVYGYGVKTFDTKEGYRCKVCKEHFKSADSYDTHLQESEHFKAYL